MGSNKYRVARQTEKTKVDEEIEKPVLRPRQWKKTIRGGRIWLPLHCRDCRNKASSLWQCWQTVGLVTLWATNECGTSIWTGLLRDSVWARDPTLPPFWMTDVLVLAFDGSRVPLYNDGATEGDTAWQHDNKQRCCHRMVFNLFLTPTKNKI